MGTYIRPSIKKIWFVVTLPRFLRLVKRKVLFSVNVEGLVNMHVVFFFV